MHVTRLSYGHDNEHTTTRFERICKSDDEGASLSMALAEIIRRIADDCDQGSVVTFLEILTFLDSVNPDHGGFEQLFRAMLTWKSSADDVHFTDMFRVVMKRPTIDGAHSPGCCRLHLKQFHDAGGSTEF